MKTVDKEQLGWDLAVCALLIVMSTIAATHDADLRGSRYALLAIALAILAIYVFGARRYVSIYSAPTPTAAVSALLQGALIALLAAAVTISPTSLLLQTVVLPLIWMTSRTTRQAVVVTLGNAAILGVAYAVWGRFDPSTAAAGFVTSGLSAVFSLAIGLWITRIAQWGAERQQLLAELTAAQAGLEAASREAGAAAERARLARDVHDTIAQSLTSIVMLAERARRDVSPDTIMLIEDAAREALREARGLVTVSSPPAEPSDSLAQALHRLGERFTRETGVQVTVDAAECAVPRDVQVVLLRCAQEGLANVRKHADASAASVTLTTTDGAVLEVRDDGRGIDPGRIERADGFGLTGMRERVGLVDGILDVAPADPRGTVLTVRIPLTKESA